MNLLQALLVAYTDTPCEFEVAQAQPVGDMPPLVGKFRRRTRVEPSALSRLVLVLRSKGPTVPLYLDTRGERALA